MNSSFIPSNDRLETIASLFQADLASLQRAIGAALSGFANARFVVAGDELSGKKSGAVTYKPSAGKFRVLALLFCCHRTGTRWAEFLSRPPACSSERQDVGFWRPSPSTPPPPAHVEAQKEVAHRLSSEGRRHPPNGYFRNYFADKGMTNWEGARYTARRYDFRTAEGRAAFIGPGLPYWVGTNCDTGEVQCIQAKFWSSKVGKYAVITCGPTRGAQVEFPPAANAIDRDSFPLIFCEGASTGWGLVQLLGGRVHVIATLGKGNLYRCAIAAKHRFGAARSLFVMSDIDANGDGQAKAAEAVQAIGAQALAPFLNCQSIEEQERSIFDEGGSFDAWDLWRAIGNCWTGIDGFLPLSDFALPASMTSRGGGVHG